MNLRESWFGFNVEWDTEGGLDSNSAHHSPEPDATTTTQTTEEILVTRKGVELLSLNCFHSLDQPVKK